MVPSDTSTPMSAADVMAIDVGNTRTRLGIFHADTLVGTWELTTPQALTADEARSQISCALTMLGSQTPRGAILSCVVPSLADAWAYAMSVVCRCRPLIVGPGLKTGFRMHYDNPAEIGADRVADIVATREHYGAPAVVVDLGTTTNFEVIDEQGVFVGGVIAPGLALGARTLSEAAARLPMVELRAPHKAIGKNTRQAMQSGIVLGEVARIDGLLDALCKELDSAPQVILTGAVPPGFEALLSHSVTLDATLTLRGLNLLWQLNRRA